MSEELSMKDFERELANSFKTLAPGDIITGTVIGVSDTEVTVDLNYFTEGIIPLEELSNEIEEDENLKEELNIVNNLMSTCDENIKLKRESKKKSGSIIMELLLNIKVYKYKIQNSI